MIIIVKPGSNTNTLHPGKRSKKHLLEWKCVHEKLAWNVIILLGDRCLSVTNIDYRCENGHFPVSASFFTIDQTPLTPASFSSGET
jgi:hypothetical protein